MRSIHDLETPVVLVDLDVLERNIARMADRARTLGVRLRPHAKTHKVIEVGRRQIAALRPTGPLPCTTTVSARARSARSTAWKPVGNPQPPPMKSSASRPSGIGRTRTPGFSSIRSAHPPRRPSAALVVMP